VIGNLVGGLSFTGLTLYATHVRTAPKRDLDGAARVEQLRSYATR
jgi:hypothetical protein